MSQDALLALKKGGYTDVKLHIRLDREEGDVFRWHAEARGGHRITLCGCGTTAEDAIVCLTEVAPWVRDEP